MRIEEKIDKYLKEAKSNYLGFDREEERIIKRKKFEGYAPEKETSGIFTWSIPESDVNAPEELVIELYKERGKKSGVEFVYSINSTVTPDYPGPVDKSFPVRDGEDNIKILKSALKWVGSKI